MATAKLTQFDADHAYHLGYDKAVKGGAKIVPGKTWIVAFSKDFFEGWEDAVREGQYATDPEYCKKPKLVF